MIMVSNQTGFECGQLVGQYPGQLGHLYSPKAQRGPWPFMPYALDNGAWSAFKRNLDWDEAAWNRLIQWAVSKKQRPLWAVVPDVVADRDRTIERWCRFAPTVVASGIRLAFAVQDGMQFDDVPSSDCMLFMGGSTSWKVAAIRPWCARFPGRVHVARVNTWDRLILCYEAGAVSVDGTGWFRKENKGNARVQSEDLRRFLEMTSAERRAA